MSLTDRERHEAYEALQRAFGDHTDAVIHMLRPDHDQLATKADLHIEASVLRTEMAALRTGMADLRTEMADLRTELKTEMSDLRTELRTEMSDVRTAVLQLQVSFKEEINTAFAAQTRLMVLSLVAAVVVMSLSNALAVFAG